MVLVGGKTGENVYFSTICEWCAYNEHMMNISAIPLISFRMSDIFHTRDYGILSLSGYE